MGDDELTTAQAAQMLGVDVSSVRSYIRAGLLPARRHGRDYAIKIADVAAFLPRKPKRGRPPTKKPRTKGGDRCPE